MLRRLDHLLVLTDDLEESRRFYCDLLGLEDGPRPGFPFTGLWLYLGGIPCVHLAERASYEANAARLGLAVEEAPVDHVAFAAQDYDGLEARLASAGIDVATNAPPGAAMRQLFVTDPNGLRIELNVPDVEPS
jgi:catechol 2,3-dioxygenase-like lactoylglutathione lyase family enzyme